VKKASGENHGGGGAAHCFVGYVVTLATAGLFTPYLLVMELL
jgi:hypothetical protein